MCYSVLMTWVSLATNGRRGNVDYAPLRTRLTDWATVEVWPLLHSGRDVPGRSLQAAASVLLYGP